MEPKLIRVDDGLIVNTRHVASVERDHNGNVVVRMALVSPADGGHVVYLIGRDEGKRLWDALTGE